MVCVIVCMCACVQGTGDYYFATAFDKVYLQPSGMVGLIGLHSETYFFKNLLAKIGITPQFFKCVALALCFLLRAIFSAVCCCFHVSELPSISLRT